MQPLKILWLFLIILRHGKSSKEDHHVTVSLNKFYISNSTERHVNIPVQNEILALNKTNLYREKTNATRSFIDENLTLKPTQTTALFTTENPLTESITHAGITENGQDEKETITERSLTTISYTEFSTNTPEIFFLKGTSSNESNSTVVEKGLFDYDGFLHENNIDDVLESVEDIFSKSGDYEFISAAHDSQNESNTDRSVSRENNKNLSEVEKFDSNIETTSIMTETTLASSTNFEIPYDYYDIIDTSTVHSEEKKSIATSTAAATNIITNILETTEKVDTTKPISTKSNDYDSEMVKILYPAFESNIYDDILHDFNYLSHEMTTLPTETKNNIEGLDYMNEYLANDDDFNVTTTYRNQPIINNTTETLLDTTNATESSTFQETTITTISPQNKTESYNDENFNFNTLYQTNKNSTTKIMAKSLQQIQVETNSNAAFSPTPTFRKSICFEKNCLEFSCIIKIFVNNSVEYLPENASLQATVDSREILLNITWSTEDPKFLIFYIDNKTNCIKRISLGYNKENKTHIMTKGDLKINLTNTLGDDTKMIDFGDGFSISVTNCKFSFNNNDDLKQTAGASKTLGDIVNNKCYFVEILGGSVVFSAFVIIAYFVFKKIKSRKDNFKPSDV